MSIATDLESRPSWLRLPSWRWFAAAYYVASPREKLYGVKDPLLKKTVRFLRDRKLLSRDFSHYMRKYPEIATAYLIFLHNQKRGWRWLLEACLMTGESPERISEALALEGLTPKTVQTYSRIFFDVEPFLGNTAAVTANVFSLTDVSLDYHGVCDYTWKRFAYRFGLDDFLRRISMNESAADQEWQEWEKDTIIQEISMNSVHIPEFLLDTQSEIALTILNTAKEFWHVSNDVADLKEKEAKEHFLRTAGEHIAFFVEHAASLEKVEERRPYRFPKPEEEDS